MQIVIDIPEEIYSYVNTQWRDIPKNDSPISIMCNAIIDGTPLPKRHGDLVDRSCICKAIYASEDNLTGSEMTYDEMDIYNDGIDSMWNKLQNATPVIIAEEVNADADSD